MDATTLIRPHRLSEPPERSAPRDTDLAVSVRGLRKRYGDRTVVDGIDLEVRAGEVVGIIGANGAGKTTTVECLQGLRSADSGEVRVLGLDPARDAARLRPRIGSQLQDAALPDRMRVEEAVELFAASGRRAAADELLHRFGLAARRRCVFSSLSGGERQRLFLVLALVNRPELVILDELTQGLDPAARREVWRAVAQLRDTGTTVLLVTHELDEAEALCDRLVAMRGGRILDSGTPAELVARHGRRATVRFGAALGAGDLAALRALPHVTAVRAEGGTVVVDGEREVIAHVGSWLVQRGTVPPDLHVEVPDLERALLAMLDADEADTHLAPGAVA